LHDNGIAVRERDEIYCFCYFGVIITFVLVKKCES
jgi:hypothetical protein